jgi:hypothetical protein
LAASIPEPTMGKTEAHLDSALAEALSSSRGFAQWFVDRTRFGCEVVECVFCRSDNPWSYVRFQLTNPKSGEIETLVKQCETDVLAVFQTTDGRRLALHIENKLAGGSFTPHQPELYRERLQQWQNRPKLGGYIDATSVLIAPMEFYDRNRSKAEVFEAFVSHEDIAALVPAFGSNMVAGGSQATPMRR